MADFICEICNGKVTPSQNRIGWFVCGGCGTEYPLAWMKAKFQGTQAAPAGTPAPKAAAPETPADHFESSLVDGGVRITGYTCNDKPAVVIPRKINGFPVTGIGDCVFQGCGNLTSVAMPNGVRTIGRDAFSGCRGLTGVAIPNSVKTIGNRAFSGCGGFTSLTIPNSVTAIGVWAFSGCGGLTSLTISTGVMEIAERTFSGCRGLTSVAIPDGVKKIEEYAFYDCGWLTNVTIPHSVTSMATNAFANTPFDKQAQQLMQQRKTWISRGLCQYCGGRLSVFGRQCKTCGKAN
jgi:hypothetical protein